MRLISKTGLSHSKHGVLQRGCRIMKRQKQKWQRTSPRTGLVWDLQDIRTDDDHRLYLLKIPRKRKESNMSRSAVAQNPEPEPCRMTVYACQEKCACVCVCARVHIYKYVSAYIQMNAHIHIHIHIFFGVHIHISIHTCTHACMLYVYTYICAYIYINRCTHVQSRFCAHSGDALLPRVVASAPARGLPRGQQTKNGLKYTVDWYLDPPRYAK